MSFDTELLAQLRTHIVLSELIGCWVRLQPHGREKRGLCPFHTEKTPSFTVNDDKGFYHCFGCSAHGDAIQFLRKIEGFSFQEAVHQLAQRAGLVHQIQSVVTSTSPNARLRAILEKAALWFAATLASPEGEKPREYLEKRGITVMMQKKFRLGWAPFKPLFQAAMMHQGITLGELVQAGLMGEKGQNAVYSRFQGRIIFPLMDDQGRVIGFGGRLLQGMGAKYLNSPETAFFSKKKHLYGFIQALKEKDLLSKPVVLVEGYLDVITLQGTGLARAVSPLGTALSAEQILKAWRLGPEPCLCFDGDTAGQVASQQAALRVLPLVRPGFSLTFARLPGGEDPDSLIQSGQNDLLMSCVEQAKPLVDQLWFQALSGTKPTTPEQRALFKKKIKTLISSIVSAEVRPLYNQAFFQKWRELFSVPKKTPFPQKYSAPPPLLPPGTTKAFDTATVQRKVLMILLVNHPNLLEHVGDDLTRLILPKGHFEHLRSFLLTVEPTNSSAALRQTLCSQGLGEFLTYLAEPDIYQHAAFAKPDAPESLAHAGWIDIFQRYQERWTVQPEIEATQRDFQNQMSLKLWNKLNSLKQMQPPV